MLVGATVVTVVVVLAVIATDDGAAGRSGADEHAATPTEAIITRAIAMLRTTDMMAPSRRAPRPRSPPTHR